MGPIEKSLREKIEAALEITHMAVINDSDHHQGHGGNPGGPETHFKLLIISKDFKDKTRLDRHRMVLAVIKEEVPHIHALSMDLRP